MLLNKKEAAHYLGISIETLDRYKAQGKLGFVKIGDRCLWTTALLDELIVSCTIPAVNLPSDREKNEIAKRAAGGVS